MSGHTDAGSRTVWHQTRSEGGSGVGVVPRTTQPGFLLLSIAVVSELVTNAYETTVRHGLDTPIALRLSSNGQQVLIEVWDADPTPPQVPALDADRLPQPDAEDGRGIFLVGALSERWNCYAVEARGGKVVWAEVAS
jgi:hypothetical protein